MKKMLTNSRLMKLLRRTVGFGLPRRCKANSFPRQFHKSAIGQHLLHNPECASHYNDDKFSIFARGRSLFHLSALEATFIESLKPIICKQKDFVHSLKLS